MTDTYISVLVPLLADDWANRSCGSPVLYVPIQKGCFSEADYPDATAPIGDADWFITGTSPMNGWCCELH